MANVGTLRSFAIDLSNGSCAQELTFSGCLTGLWEKILCRTGAA